jgi:hypothetical protein
MTSEALDQINTMVVETRWGDREFRLFRGDITKLNFPVDLMVISSIESDYEQAETSVIGSLFRNRNISVAQLGDDPEFTLVQPMKLWVSRDTGNSDIRTIMCVEIPLGGRGANRIVEDAFFSLPLLEARGLVLSTICLPILATGDHGLNAQQMIAPILKGSAWALRNLDSVERVCFVVRTEERARMISDAMNAELERPSVALPKSDLVDSILRDIPDRLEKIAKLDPHRNFGALGAKLSRDSTSEQIGMAARQLRDDIITQIMNNRRNGQDRNAEYNALKSEGVAEWIISYLNMLRTVGNETAHEPMDRRKLESRLPPKLDRGDLALCLFVIQIVLEFWTDWLSGLKGHGGGTARPPSDAMR